ncbi:MAG TPA: ATP-binding protein [Microvirga sp.]|nr:ATP-binding protein [Microvirga sp.]
MRAIMAVAAIATVAFSFLALLFTAILSEGRMAEELRDKRDRAIENRAIARRAFSLLQEAEIGQLRLLLTADREFADRHQAAVQQLPALLDELLQHTKDAAEHSQAVQLSELARAELSMLSRILEAGQQTGLDAAVAIERDHRRRTQHAQIRAVVANILEAENRDIDTYSAAVRERTARFERMTLSLAMALGLVLLAASAGAGSYILRRHRSDEELREAKARAEEASRAKTEFLASMSHEIRTPLNAVIGYTELLLDHDIAPEQRRLMERIQFAGAALLTVVNDILDFSKIEAGQVSLDPSPFSLEALIDNTVSVISEIAERKGLALHVRLDPGLPKGLLGDEARLRQILLNLLNNAVKFTDHGSVTLEVKCSSSSSDCDSITFLVKDTGIGIPQDERKNLFHRFYQVHHSSTRRFGGTGLGLAISKRLVELMGGEIGLESREGYGSTFWFTVPLPAVDERVLAGAGAETSAELVSPARILLVEDLEHNRDLARRILTNAGHQVDTANNGEEAVAAVQAKDYDLVLMDIQMPVMDGVTATRTIRALDHPARKIPIIAMTANVLPSQVKAFADAGMNDHVGKPFRKAELFQKINTWVRRSGVDAQPPAPVDRPGKSALDELRELMGPEWVESGLVKLRELIREAFGDEAAPPDRQQLAATAHALVSHSALLGFLELSRLCAELETACIEGHDLSAAYQKAKAAAGAVEPELLSGSRNREVA